MDGGARARSGTPRLVDIEFDNISERVGRESGRRRTNSRSRRRGRRRSAPRRSATCSARARSGSARTKAVSPNRVFDPLDGRVQVGLQHVRSEPRSRPGNLAPGGHRLRVPCRVGAKGLRSDWTTRKSTSGTGSSLPFELGLLLPPQVYGAIEDIFIRRRERQPDRDGQSADQHRPARQRDHRPGRLGRRWRPTSAPSPPDSTFTTVVGQFDQAFSRQRREGRLRRQGTRPAQVRAGGQAELGPAGTRTADLRVHYQPAYDNNTFVNDNFTVHTPK